MQQRRRSDDGHGAALLRSLISVIIRLSFRIVSWNQRCTKLQGRFLPGISFSFQRPLLNHLASLVASCTFSSVLCLANTLWCTLMLPPKMEWLCVFPSRTSSKSSNQLPPGCNFLSSATLPREVSVVRLALEEEVSRSWPVTWFILIQVFNRTCWPRSPLCSMDGAVSGHAAHPLPLSQQALLLHQKHQVVR